MTDDATTAARSLIDQDAIFVYHIFTATSLFKNGPHLNDNQLLGLEYTYRQKDQPQQPHPGDRRSRWARWSTDQRLRIRRDIALSWRKKAGMILPTNLRERASVMDMAHGADGGASVRCWSRCITSAWSSRRPVGFTDLSVIRTKRGVFTTCWTGALGMSMPRRSPGGRQWLVFAMFMPTQDEMRDATPDERGMLDSAGYFWSTLSGYAQLQQTRPQTIGYALGDSPVAQAAWIPLYSGRHASNSDSGLSSHP